MENQQPNQEQEPHWDQEIMPHLIYSLKSAASRKKKEQQMQDQLKQEGNQQQEPSKKIKTAKEIKPEELAKEDIERAGEMEEGSQPLISPFQIDPDFNFGEDEETEEGTNAQFSKIDIEGTPFAARTAEQ